MVLVAGSAMSDTGDGRGRGAPSGRGYSIGTYQDSNGFKVKTDDGTWVGWVYPMDYVPGLEGTWGAISSADGETSDPSLYREGFDSKNRAAAWLIARWNAGSGTDISTPIDDSDGDQGC